MGGLFVDIFAVSVYNDIVRLFRFIASRRWRKVEAVILNATVERGVAGCIRVKARYQITADKEPWPMEDELPFHFEWDANRYAQKVAVDRKIMIRVHPKYASETAFFEFDQN